ncbi:MAG: RtcB family protein [Fibromonadaceae bacterium]|jgi:RNA-splicing ligase RtcB|nr:RtcB family protein [Fibromonadaceae bacterium]
MSYSITGSYATATVYASNVEEACEEQIREVCDKEFLANEKIRIMPDCHYGKNICIGFTSTMKSEWAVPNYIGVDIGCGVASHPIGVLENIDFKEFDKQVRRSIPVGKSIHKRFDEDRCKDFYAKITKKSMHLFIEEINELIKKINLDFRSKHYVEQSIGTLGGGNHFIALNKGKDGEVFVTIHSGSRNFGLKIAEHFQRRVGKDGYLSGELYKDYIYAMELAQKYAGFNRVKMLCELLRYFDVQFDKEKFIESVHNYIDMENRIIRKGAISAQSGELCLIPINMADGTLLCRGKGNADWNYSAPHGAGRVLSRNRAYKELTLEEYKKQMEENNVWSSCITKGTLDESPMAYKKYKYLLKFIGDTVDVLDHWAEIYNFKCAG